MLKLFPWNLLFHPFIIPKMNYRLFILLIFLSLISVSRLLHAQEETLPGNDPQSEDQTSEEEEEIYHPYKRDEPMVFHLAYSGSAYYTIYWIAAQGRITKNTPRDFENFLRHDKNYLEALQDIAESDKRDQDIEYRRQVNSGRTRLWSEFEAIYVHSCGGDERAAMQLGRLFRKYKLAVGVGQTYPSNIEYPLSHSLVSVGECNGACAFTQLSHPLAFNYDISKEEYERKKKKVLQPSYLPIILGPFRTPLKEILAYTKEMDVDPLWKEELFPKHQKESRILSNWQAGKLGIWRRYEQPDDDLPPEERQPCRR